MKRAALFLALSAFMLCTQEARAQRRRPVREAAPAPAREPGWLGSSFGVDAVARKLASDSPADRELALERLGSLRLPRALTLLSAALETDGAARTSRERLVAVRALAPHAATPEARLSLLRAMSGGTADASRDELALIVQHSAALALAASGADAALAALGKALRQEGPLADIAADALEAHPPETLRPLLATPGPATPALVRVLGVLGDQRAFFELRRAIQRGGPSVRAEAALALTLLGDYETVELARRWYKTERSAELKLAGARILAMARDREAPAAIVALLRDDELGDRGLELALEAPHAALAPELQARLERADSDQAPLVLGALARAGSVTAIERALRKPALAASAAHALSLVKGEAAGQALERALRQAALRRLAARAATFRQLVLGESVSGLREALSALLASADPADRAAGAWGTAMLDTDRARKLVGSRDAATARAAARAALEPRVAVAAAERLNGERDWATVSALSLALAVPAAAALVPTRVLLDLFEAGGPGAPLAARALALRNTSDLSPRIQAMLESPDELTRAHAALGLGDSENPQALAWLVQRYRFETNRQVRRAIVVAASRRSEASRTSLLRLAATLDPDRDVRQNARRALGGERLDAGGAGPSGAWVTLSPNAPSALDAVSGRPLLVQTPGGLALPLVADADGVVCLTPLAAGPIVVRLAAPPMRGKPHKSNFAVLHLENESHTKLIKPPLYPDSLEKDARGKRRNPSLE